MAEATHRTTSFDKDALRARYAQERDKRLRTDGNEQYIEITGQLGHYLEDPYTPVTEREPLDDHVTFAFIGGGFSGLVTGARVKEAGVEDVRIIEKGGDFGGTWYWNRYPGAQCDTAAMIYLPLLEETGHMPSEKYVHAPEILEHCRRIGRHYALYDDALFHTQVTDLRWKRRRSAGASARIAATTSRRSSWARHPGRFTCRSSRAFQASNPSQDTASTRVAGTTTTREAIRAGRLRTSLPTSA